MKKILRGLIVTLFIPSVISAQPFVPNTLHLNPNHPHREGLSFDYSSDGVYIPVEVQGGAARTVLMIYTSGKGDEIGTSRHGYRGWHWINKVDTSIYIAPSVDLAPGDNPTAIFWDFSDKDGNKTAWAGEFNYYLFAYEPNTPKTQVMMRQLNGSLMGVYYQASIDVMGEGGLPREAPLIVSRNRRWVIGGDPNDPANYKTTSQSPSQLVAIDKHDENYFYATYNHNATLSKHVRRYQWVENGVSIQDLEWGFGDGEILGFTPIWEGLWGAYAGTLEYAGTASDLDYIYTAGNMRGAPVNYFYVLDYDGNIVNSFDMSHIYIPDPDPPEGEGVFRSGGPNQVRMFNEFSSTKLNLNHHGWCWRVVVDPIRGLENPDDFVMWVNGNGDWFTDNFTPEVMGNPVYQWICNTVNSAPYTFQMTSDANGVGVIHTYGLGLPTFALFGPDGTGAGYHALYGESGERLKYATHFVKYGTQWDGLYTDANSTHPPAEGNDPSGVWYTPANSFAGKLVAGPPPTPTVATPVFSPAPGTHSGSVEVTITCATQHATIYYTLNGDTPYYNSPVYTGPINISSTTTLKARAYDDNVFGQTYTPMNPSDVVSGIYSIKPYLSNFTINSGATTTPCSTVNLIFSAAPSPTHYIASENAVFSGASWQQYSGYPEFTLSSGHGSKVVYLKVKNDAGESNVLSYEIEYTSTPFAAVPETGESHAVVLQSSQIYGEPLQAGDWIGVFDGTRCVGVLCFEGTYPSTITVWLEFLIPGEDPLPGAIPGNNMTFKAWRNSTGRLYVNLTPSYSKGAGLFGEPLTVVSLSDGVPLISDSIALSPGRANLISFSLESEDMSIESLLSGVPSLVVVKDDNQKFYIPPQGINTIGSADVKKGYLTYHSGNQTANLLITGTPVKADTISYSFTDTRWYIIPCPYQEPAGVEWAFDAIADKVSVMKDDAGNFWIPEFGINSISTIQPGRGYMIFVDTACGFTWPAQMPAAPKQATKTAVSQPPLQHFEFAETGMYYPVVISSSNIDLEYGDEIGVFDGELCVGAVVFTGSLPMVIAAAEGFPLYGMQGYTAGNEILLKVWKSREIKTYVIITNGGTFESGSYGVLQMMGYTGIETPSSEPLEYSLGQNYPNPFNLSTTISYAVPKAGRVVLRIYDVNGRLVRTLADSEFSAGHHQAVWDGHNDAGDVVGAGIYFLRMHSGDFRKTIRMLLLK